MDNQDEIDAKEFLAWKKSKENNVSKCSFCEYELVQDDIYYKCKQHKNVYCERCAKPKMKEVLYSESPHCKDKNGITQHDCEWEKRVK